MPIFVVSLVAPGTTLSGAELFHLSNALLELLVLALLVAVSLVLLGINRHDISYIHDKRNSNSWINSCGSNAPRTSREGSTLAVGSGSMGSGGQRKSRGTGGEDGHPTSPDGRQLNTSVSR